MNNYLFWKRFAQGKLKTHVSSVKIRIPSSKEILSWSERRLPNSTLVGKIDNAHTVEHDTLRPVSGGLFCERIFGPIATNVCACLRRKGWNEDFCKICEVQFTKSRLRRYQMGHILLAAPVIHIWALQGGYLANLLGKKNSGIRSIAYGKVMCQSKLWKNATCDFFTEPIVSYFDPYDNVTKKKKLLKENYLIKTCLTNKESTPLVCFAKKPVGLLTCPYLLRKHTNQRCALHVSTSTICRGKYSKYACLPCLQSMYASKVCTKQDKNIKFFVIDNNNNFDKTTKGYSWNKMERNGLDGKSKKIQEDPKNHFFLSQTQNNFIGHNTNLISTQCNMVYWKHKKIRKDTKIFSTHQPLSLDTLKILRNKDVLTQNKDFEQNSHLHVNAGCDFNLGYKQVLRQTKFGYVPYNHAYTNLTCSSLTCFASKASKARGISKMCLPYGYACEASKQVRHEKGTNIEELTWDKRYNAVISKNKIKNLFLSYTRNLCKKKRIKNQIQKVYERGNVLPFHQFLLYKPDTFNKITQFFNSLDKEEKNFPLPHYSKQKFIFCSNKGSLPPNLLESSYLHTDFAKQVELSMAKACAYKSKICNPMGMLLRSKKHVRGTSKICNQAKMYGFVRKVIHRKQNNFISRPNNFDSQFFFKSFLQFANKGMLSSENFKENKINVLQKDIIRDFGVFNRIDTLNWGIFYNPEFISQNVIRFPKDVLAVQNKQVLVYKTLGRSANKSNKQVSSTDLYACFAYPCLAQQGKGMQPCLQSMYASKSCKICKQTYVNRFKNKYNITKKLIDKTLAMKTFRPSKNKFDAFGYPMPCIANKSRMCLLAKQAYMQSKQGYKSCYAQMCLHAYPKGKQAKQVGYARRQAKQVGYACFAYPCLAQQGKGMQPCLQSMYASKARVWSWLFMDRLKQNSSLIRPKPSLTDVKNIAYTGSSVLFQSLKNLNLVLLDSLISWKWKKFKTQLNCFLLQNKLTKKKRNLRNKLAKAKIILTKRKNLVQSFLSTKQLPEWMIISILPILPPALRPILELEPNNVVVSDLNVLYQTVIRRNDALMGLLTFRALEIDILNRQVSLQQSIEKLFDKGAGTKKRPVKSLSQGFHGKKGLFRSHLLGKRVDYSGRSVIVVGPQLKLHECGLPKEMALVLFLPFLIARLKKRKIVSNTSQAKQLIFYKDKQIWSHLKSLIYEHPVLLNRAPTLHRLGFQAFQPILVSGKAMILPALVCTGFNADFDGDQMAVHVPLSHAARAESWKLLHAKNNMLSPATGKPIIVLSQEMILGCYCSSLILNKTHFMTYSVKENNAFSLGAYDTSLHTFKNLLGANLGKQLGIRASYMPYLLGKQVKAYNSKNCKGKYSTYARRSIASRTCKQANQVRVRNIKSTKNFYFTTFQEIYKALGESKIAIQTTVWLRIPFFEDNQFLEEPLEIRLDAMGHFFRSYCQSQRHFSKNIKSQDQTKGISYIRTSAGRIQLNEVFYSSWS